MFEFLDNSYKKALSDNEANLTYYNNYKESHEKVITTLNTFRDTLEPDVLVPVCTRILMQGTLVHTNEVTVSLGCGYFTKCSVADALEICKRRIKKTDDILNKLEKEKEFLESQIKFRGENIFPGQQKEIVEPYDEAKEKGWRKEHAIRLKEERIKENKHLQSIDHKEIMQKLELLELQDEIEKLHSNTDLISKNMSRDSEEFLNTNTKENTVFTSNVKDISEKNPETHSKKAEINTEDYREFQLRKKLAALRQRKKEKCTTEKDIFKRLDELEEEEKIEDELDRLYETMYGNKESDHEEEISDEEEQEEVEVTPSPRRKVSFPKTDVEIQTINITFKHSENKLQDYSDYQKGEIVSPSDIYKMFPENFKNCQMKGIIKNLHKVKEEIHKTSTLNDSDGDEIKTKERATVSFTISLDNVVEHHTKTTAAATKTQRPVSKFKSMRLANKSVDQ